MVIPPMIIIPVTKFKRRGSTCFSYIVQAVTVERGVGVGNGKMRREEERKKRKKRGERRRRQERKKKNPVTLSCMCGSACVCVYGRGEGKVSESVTGAVNRVYLQKCVSDLCRLPCQRPRTFHGVETGFQISYMDGLFNFDLSTISSSVQYLDMKHAVDVVTRDVRMKVQNMFAEGGV